MFPKPDGAVWTAAIACASLLVGGCTLISPPTQRPGVTTTAAPGNAQSGLDAQLARFVATARDGDESKIVPVGGGKPIRVRRGKEYYSGAGMICRKIIFVEASESQGVPLRAGCLDHGVWRIFGVHGR